MAKVVQFPTHECRPLYWQCGCGCVTFYIRDDGATECAHCDTVDLGADGRWRTEVDMDKVREEEEAATPLPILQVTQSEDTAQRRVAKAAAGREVSVIIVLRQSGTVHIWGTEFTSRAQRGWLNGRMALALRTLKPTVKEKNHE